MTELTRRSGSQILRSFLPQQTADVAGRIVRIVEWDNPRRLPVDTLMVKRRLVRDIVSWTLAGTDSDLARGLETSDLEILALDTQRGVSVERWPTVWLCRSCRRVGRSLMKDCRCGQRRWGQLHFVGFHTCGAMYEPWIQRCPEHDDVMMISPKSTNARDIQFRCPSCSKLVMTGLGFKQCQCGGGPVIWNVHKARSVFAPRSIVLVNPPRPERMKELTAAGGSAHALAWVLDGMTDRTPATPKRGLSRAGFIADLVDGKGFDPALAEQVADQAQAGGGLIDETVDALDGLGDEQRRTAEHEATDLGMAVWEARVTVADLAAAAPNQALGDLYQSTYPKAFAAAGLDSVDFVERFPILNGVYGFVRGGGEPGEHRLVPYRSPRGGYRIFGEQVETEALLFRMDPVRVVDWLRHRGYHIPFDGSSPRSARVALLGLQSSSVAEGVSPGQDLRVLVHSYAHRVIRQAAVAAGIDRDSLSEYLVPMHAAFFVYAHSGSSFVLGGLQSVFETELNNLLDAVVDAERRCPLDPGCARGKAACLACLHLGEPSCRHFNAELDRRVLFGELGYL